MTQALAIAYPDHFPNHLKGEVAQGGVIGEPIAQFLIGSMQNLVYLIIDWKAKVAAIVDPQKDLSPIDHFLESHQLKLAAIFLTHSHHDHIAGVPALRERLPEIPLFVHEQDVFRLPNKLQDNLQGKAFLLKGGEELKVGSLTIGVVHAPGHSAGEVCFYLNPFLLSGDTLFVRECGRTDLPTGNDLQMFETLQKIKQLPADTVLLPGHQYATEVNSWLSREMESSLPLLAKNPEEFARL